MSLDTDTFLKGYDEGWADAILEIAEHLQEMGFKVEVTDDEIIVSFLNAEPVVH